MRHHPVLARRHTSFPNVFNLPDGSGPEGIVATPEGDALLVVNTTAVPLFNPYPKSGLSTATDLGDTARPTATDSDRRDPPSTFAEARRTGLRWSNSIRLS